MARAYRFLFGILVLTGCSFDFEKANKEYKELMARLEQPGNVDTSVLPGVWQKTQSHFLYQDEYNANFDSVTDQKYTDSGELLAFEGGDLAKIHLRVHCPFRYEQPEELLTEMLGPKDSHKPEKDPIDIPSFITAARDKHSEAFATFGINGKSLSTQKKLRVEVDPKTQFPDESFSLQILSANDKNLEIAFRNNKPPTTGVHTVIDTYTRMNGEELKKLLLKARKQGPCDNSRPVPPTNPTGGTTPPFQAPPGTP